MFDIESRIAPTMGSYNIRINFKVDLVPGPILELETFIPTKFSLI
jgi:hypothetical protein